MNRIALVLSLLLIGCGSTSKFEGDADSDPTADTSLDTNTDTAPDTAPDTGTDAHDPRPDRPPDSTDTPGEPDGPACHAGETRCSTDLHSLETCRSDGSGWDATACPFDCSPTPDPHCLEWVISNIPDSSLLSVGAPPTDTTPWPTDQDYWLNMDTDTGQITITRFSDDSLVREIRPADHSALHTPSGTHFTILSQGSGAPDLGVFSFQSFELPPNYIVYPTGERALVILSEDDATIAGGVYNGCTVFYGGSSSNTEGTGAGGNGSSVGSGESYRDGGGGGGGYGGPGGSGGGYTVSLRGTPGTTYGTPELIPLLGGSGGGDGGGVSGGRWGGPSGGATQIVSGGTLTISGYVAGSGCGGYSASYAPEGGGGGGSGGGVLLEAPQLVVTGAVTANGGGGAAGGGAGEPATIYGWPGYAASGDPAPGGTAVFTYSCNGGAGSDSSGHGANAPECTSYTYGYNAGGGGGGAGRIRLNGMSRTLTGLLSPPMSAPMTTQAELTLI